MIICIKKILFIIFLFAIFLATNPCSVPLAPGTGNAGVARWYYNSDDRQCVSFQYNGKRGNQNNFLSKVECERTCPGK